MRIIYLLYIQTTVSGSLQSNVRYKDLDPVDILAVELLVKDYVHGILPIYAAKQQSKHYCVWVFKGHVNFIFQGDRRPTSVPQIFGTYLKL